MIQLRFSRIYIDWPLFYSLLILIAVGLLVIYSASNQNTDMIIRQIVRIAVALCALIFFAQIEPDTLYRWSPYIYTLGLGLLVLVLLFGITGKGAQRWLNLGFIRLQPSEIMKLAVPMMTAWIMVRFSFPANFKSITLALIAITCPCAMVIMQPDLGTAILIAVSGLVVLFLAAVSWKLIFLSCGLIGAIAPFLWTNLHSYQQNRILTLFDPWSDPLGAGYHTIQSIIAIGSGGMYGKGWLNGTQSRLDFIPEQSTDFIFSVFAEEFGLVGVFLLLGLYMFIILRCLKISLTVQHTYSRLLAGSLATTFFCYLFVNIGMVSGILPIVGVPLPLISYGGTSMVTLMAAFGVLMSISTHKKLMH